MSFCLPETSSDRQDICFIHAIFCHTGLPRSPVPRSWFSRSSGAAWLSLFTGQEEGNGEQDAGGNRDAGRFSAVMPFGPLPRLLLVWLSTAALRRDTPDIVLGPSISGWLQHIGMAADGRRYLAFHRQVQALARSRLTIGFQDVEFDGRLLSLPGLSACRPDGAGDETGDGTGAGTPPPGPRALRQARAPLHIRLAPAYIHTLMRHAVPLQWSAVRHLRGSALSLDVYFWLAWRLCRLPDDPLFLSWEQLHAQFGSEYRSREAVRLFRRELLRRLPDIERVYPSARIQVVADGMVFSPSPPPVPSRQR